MKMLLAEQMRALDKYTIGHEPVTPINLMERAASKFAASMLGLIKFNQPVYVFCGMGNNGGDGLAVARIFAGQGYNRVQVFIVKHTNKPSDDFTTNEERLKENTYVKYLGKETDLPTLDSQGAIIDAIFGSGLSRPAEGIAASTIRFINQSGLPVYSIDVPSGLYCDEPNGPEDAIVQSTCTYTFHSPKLSFMFAENGKYVPDFKILDIGLDKEFSEGSDSPYSYVNHALIHSFFKKRNKFSNKGTFGHALIAAGSYGKMGAALLSVKAALRSGAGLISAQIPGSGYEIMQVSNPEAMVETDLHPKWISTQPKEPKKYSAIGIGPGIGKEKETVNYLKILLEGYQKPLVLDADALNIISEDKELLRWVPANSILTPHPGEFKRLAGDWKDDLEKIEKQIEFSKTHKVVLVLKGANTSISTIEGKIYFNSTGNAGMAKGGSGDILTGMLTSILAQGYSSIQTAVMGVFIHGCAGDYAKKNLGQTSMKAQDIIYYLPKAFSQFE